MSKLPVLRLLRLVGAILLTLLAVPGSPRGPAAPAPAAPGDATEPLRPLTAPTTLPPLPGGLPAYFSFGLYSIDPTWLQTSAIPWNLRYNYLSGGVTTPYNWATWESPRGQYAVSYINASRAAGTIPIFM